MTGELVKPPQISQHSSNDAKKDTNDTGRAANQHFVLCERQFLAPLSNDFAVRCDSYQIDSAN